MSAIDVERFHELGYAVIPRVFAPEEAEEVRRNAIDQVTSLVDRGEASIDEGPGGRALHPAGDMLTYDALRKVLLDRRLVNVVAEVLGGTPCYWGESSVVVGSFGGARAWHTDAYHTAVSRGRKYPLIRCGLYLQDIESYSGGLCLRPRSHAWRFTRYRPDLAPTLIKLVDSKPGDLVVWDMRIAHAGEAVRMRGARRLGLPLSLQGRLPESLRLPEERERVVMFPTFGLEGPDLDRYIEYGRTRDYLRDIWRVSQFSAEVWSEAEAAGLKLVRPVPEWGRPRTTAGAPG